MTTNSPKPGNLSLGKLTNMEIGFDEKPQDANNLLGKNLPNLQGPNTNINQHIVIVPKDLLGNFWNG